MYNINISRYARIPSEFRSQLESILLLDSQMATGSACVILHARWNNTKTTGAPGNFGICKLASWGFQVSSTKRVRDQERIGEIKCAHLDARFARCQMLVCPPPQDVAWEWTFRRYTTFLQKHHSSKAWSIYCMTTPSSFHKRNWQSLPERRTPQSTRS